MFLINKKQELLMVHVNTLVAISVKSTMKGCSSLLFRLLNNGPLFVFHPKITTDREYPKVFPSDYRRAFQVAHTSSNVEKHRC